MHVPRKLYVSLNCKQKIYNLRPKNILKQGIENKKLHFFFFKFCWKKKKKGKKKKEMEFKVSELNLLLIMPPTSKKLEGHIASGLFVRLSIRPFITLFDA